MKTAIRVVTLGLHLLVMGHDLGLCERLLSFLYSIPYHGVESEIANPRTHSGLYPDSLRWSPGGEPKYGLQAVIACNKGAHEYMPTELIGVRAGIRNVSDASVELGFAFYSPNKLAIPPEYTLLIEGPYSYPRAMGYLGDDVILDGPRTRLKNMISVRPARVFNPSFDSLFYNSTDGLFSFEVPGIYKMWFTYSFDSLTSSLQVPMTVITSDTIEIEVKAPKFLDTKKLTKFLPRKIRGFEAGKSRVANEPINLYWKESLSYPLVHKYYFQTKGDFASPHIGMLIIDSGRLPGILNRWHVPGMLAESSDTTIGGFPACKQYEASDQQGRSLVVISVIVADRIVVRIDGRGVQMKETEKAAGAVDYAAIAKAVM